MEALYKIGFSYYKIERYNDSLKYLYKILKIEPDNSETIFLIGDVFRQIGKELEAKNYYARAININIKLKDRYRNIGKNLIKEKKYKEAVIYYSKYSLKIKNNVEELSNFGAALIRIGKEKEGRFYINYALKIKEVPYIYNNFAKALLDIEKFEEAKKNADKALELDISYLDAKNTIGDIFMKKEEYIEAFNYYKDVLKSDPKNSYASKKLSLISKKVKLKKAKHFKKVNDIIDEYNLACVLVRENKIDEAKKTFLNIIKKDNKNTKSIYGLAYIEQKANNFLSAEKYYRRAVELEPKYEEALYGLAYSLLTLKKHSEAIEVFQKVLNLNKDNDKAMFLIAICYIKKNNKIEAEKYLKKFLKIKPDNVEAKKILNQIKTKSLD